MWLLLKLSMTFSTEPEQTNPKIYMELRKTQNCQSNPEEKEQTRKYNFPRLQILLQSYSDQNSMALA